MRGTDTGFNLGHHDNNNIAPIFLNSDLLFYQTTGDNTILSLEASTYYREASIVLVFPVYGYRILSLSADATHATFSKKNPLTSELLSRIQEVLSPHSVDDVR